MKKPEKWLTVEQLDTFKNGLTEATKRDTPATYTVMSMMERQARAALALLEEVEAWRNGGGDSQQIEQKMARTDAALAKE